MSYYGGFWRNIKKATTFFGRRGTTEPRLGQDPPAVRTLRAGRSRHRPKASALRRFHKLAWPSYFTIGIGGYFHWLALSEGIDMSARVPFGFFPVIMTAVCLVFAARALGAVESAAIRYPTTVLNLAYPASIVVFLLL